MPTSAQQQELADRFAAEYARGQTPVMLEVERAVCGCDYGGTSWTTREEADTIGRLLGLGKGTRLLEMGSGSGWPALYLASTTGCDVTLTDVPGEALRIASRRAARDELDGRAAFALASGPALPFAPQCFDAVSHSDVLCCLQEKRGFLNECRRVANGDATMVFTVISVAPGLDDADHARAVESGPPFVECECEYPRLLDECGWSLHTVVDVTPAYEDTGKRHLREVRARTRSLSDLLGEIDFEEFLARRRRNVAAVERRILRRELFVVRRR